MCAYVHFVSFAKWNKCIWVTDDMMLPSEGGCATATSQNSQMNENSFTDEVVAVRFPHPLCLATVFVFVILMSIGAAHKRWPQTRFQICRMEMAEGTELRKEIEKTLTHRGWYKRQWHWPGNVCWWKKIISRFMLAFTHRAHTQTTNTFLISHIRLHYLSFYFSARPSRDGRLKKKASTECGGSRSRSEKENK